MRAILGVPKAVFTVTVSLNVNTKSKLGLTDGECVPAAGPVAVRIVGTTPSILSPAVFGAVKVRVALLPPMSFMVPPLRANVGTMMETDPVSFACAM